jgi:DNA polymerase III epsilon subunit family exonuclease
MMTPQPRNLIPDSPLLQETVEMLRVCGGRAPAADIADIVLKLPDLDAEIAAMLVADLIKDDRRFILRDHAVELDCENVEARLLQEAEFVVVDLETTGAKTPPCRVTEIGAYKISRGRIVAEFQTLVNPAIEIPPYIVQLTGISNEMVRTAPNFEDIARSWLDFADEAVLVAHNAQFDVRFLNHEIARVFPGRRMANSHLCTVKLSRKIFPGLQNYRLHTVADHFSIRIINRHRAADDALATAEIFLHMLARLDKHGVRDVAGARIFSFNPNGEC